MLERILAIPGISCCNPVGAFYLFPNVKAYFGMSYNGKTIRNATDLAEVLLKEAQVAVVPGIAFGNDDYIRLSYACAVEKIEAGLDRVAELIKKIM